MIFDDDDAFEENILPECEGDWPVDVYEYEDKVCVDIVIPNLDIDTVELDTTERKLFINGSIFVPSKDDRKYFLQEIERGEFARIVDLPTEVSVESVDLDYEDGVLSIYMNKLVKKQKKTLPGFIKVIKKRIGSKK